MPEPLKLPECPHCGALSAINVCTSCNRSRDDAPLCRNCAHYRDGPKGWDLDTCAYPRPVRTDPVRGLVLDYYCSLERMTSARCGPAGTLYERRNPF